jgi:BMFP domain-containing protein YqiC
MGFAKSSEIENLNARIAELENRLKGVSGVKKDSTSKPKKPVIKKSAAPKKVSKSSKASAAIKSTKKKVSK